jgi:hypothetical protein
MLMRRILLASSLVLAGASGLSAQSARSDIELLALGHKMTVWFYHAQTDSLLAHFDARFREEVGGVAGVQQEVAQFLDRAGTEQMVIEEKMTRRKGHPQYWREATFDGFTAEPIVIRWVFDDQGQVIGIGTTPKSHTPPAD